MTKQEFTIEAKRLIYKDVAIHVNQILGVSKTNQASIGLFGHIPIEIEARKIKAAPLAERKVHTLATNVSAYLKHDNASAVYFSIFYEKDGDLKKVYSAIEKHTYYFSYLYMRELFRLMRNHNTKTYYNMMRKQIMTSNRSISAGQFLHVINTASQYAINTYLYQLFQGSDLQKVADKFFPYENYDPKFKLLPENQILDELLQNDYNPGTPWVDSGFEFYNDSTSIEHYSNFELNDEYEEQIVDIGETIKNHITESTKGRGTAAAEIFKAAFKEQKVKTGWFKKLRKSFKRIVKQQTENYYTSWSSLNSVYRHKFKAPKHIYEKDSIELYLSVDHSGSMSEEELGKLLYLIKSQSKKISKLTVWIHDTEISKEFILESDYDLQEDPQFKAALGNRYNAGGTSHLCIAKKLNEIKPDPTKSIFISFSDNYSDIPNAWAKYPNLTKIPTYFLCTLNNPVNVKGTVDITME